MHYFIHMLNIDDLAKKIKVQHEPTLRYINLKLNNFFVFPSSFQCLDAISKVSQYIKRALSIMFMQ